MISVSELTPCWTQSDRDGQAKGGRFKGSLRKLRIMWARIARIIEILNSQIGLFLMLGGGAFIAGAFGFATWATKALQPYAPFSWVLAALGGVLVSSATFWLICKGRDIWIRASVVKLYSQEHNIVNPKQNMFQGLCVNVNDLILPSHRQVVGKTFIDCDIVGPANIGLVATSPGKGSLNACEFYSCAAAEIQENRQLPFGIALVDCNFLRCRIFGLIIFMTDSDRKNFASVMPEAFWLTPNRAG